MSTMPEIIDGFPNISGHEKELFEATTAKVKDPIYLHDTPIDFNNIKSCVAAALHMHQPLIPAGGDNLQTAEIISNLQHMFEHSAEGDNYNAGVFKDCYQRLGRMIPELVNEGKEPRIMVEYSGALLYGLRKMGADDVFDLLIPLTQDPRYRRAVEWLGSPWGHAVAPSTPVQDYRLHVKAWQHNFAAIFGWDALSRVRGFSPSEMALPNHPDVAYEFVKTLVECGYRWVLVQEHTVETPEGHGVQQKHIPHRLVCRNSKGEVAEIIALIKTQGSDTKLVAQMQPYYEAKGLDRITLAGKSIPQIVTQIADGENGGVMMNEFPPKYMEVMREASATNTAPINGTEYLELLEAAGVQQSDLPVIQPIKQALIWERMESATGPEKLAAVIKDLSAERHDFNVEGGSWTNNISWVRGYENVLGPMEKASSLFNEKVLKAGVSPDDPRFRKALFFLMSSQTSCYRYWGQGIWTDYGKEISRRAIAVLENDF
ncbi:MAG: glycosyl hydrolase family 57 [Bdellovibrionota bacterium]|jgi:hypothetical protein